MNRRVVIAGIIATSCVISSAQIKFEAEIIEYGGEFMQGITPMNELGQVAGKVSDSRIMIWESGVEPKFIDVVSGRDHPMLFFEVTAISDAGEILGYKFYVYDEREIGRFETDAFYYSEESGFIHIGDLGAHPESIGIGVSLDGFGRNGLAYGISHNSASGADGLQYATFTWAPGQDPKLLGTLVEEFGHSSTVAKDMNASGVLVGNFGYRYTMSGGHGEDAFMYDADNGLREIHKLDPPFFNWFQCSAFGINDLGLIVGNFATTGFTFDMETGEGVLFYGFGTDEDGDRGDITPRAINERGLVAGHARDHERSEDMLKTPFIWKKGLETARIYDALTEPIETILPPGHPQEESLFTIASVNNRGQISGTLRNFNSSNVFEIPLVLSPIFDYVWKDAQETERSGVRGFEFTYAENEEGLSAEYFEMTMTYEVSADLENWEPIVIGENGIIEEISEDGVTIFIPSESTIFLRSRLLLDDLPQ